MKTIRYRMLKSARIANESGGVVEYDAGRFYRLSAERAAALIAAGICKPETVPVEDPTHAPEAPGELAAGIQDETEETRAEPESEPDDENEEEEE